MPPMALAPQHDASPSPYAIETKGLVKRYGRTSALRGVDLAVPWGECLALLGANGSGKTTLIRALAALVRPTEGEVRIAGRDPFKGAPGLRRLLGVVTHQPFLYQDLTAYENLLFYGRMYGISDQEDRIQQISGLLRVEAHLHRKVRTLSHGTQQRLSLARALLHDPPILLLDEPETGLDQEAQQILERLLKDRPPGRTVVLTTHSLEQGLAVGSRVALLDRGRIVYQEQRDLLDAGGLRARYAHLVGATP
ncbi:MAG: ABC transporter ATP-binding protein [Dehalococcoidia bacterium]|nr:ABC transporter ATP-binding protein [Dehalococcoidia bacterium]